jgi:TRAP-type mannitol/chloroaromatic compound transport system permease small subunit
LKTKGLIEAIEAITESVGRAVSWLSVVMGFMTCAIVVLRYGFDSGAIAAQELVLYLHATAFMLGISYASKHDEHVRVDVIYSRLSVRGRAWVNLCGHVLFLFPCALTILWISTPYVFASWRILEGSAEVGGFPGIFALKTLIPIMAIMLLLQGFAELLQAMSTLKNTRVTNPSTPGSNQ